MGRGQLSSSSSSPIPCALRLLRLRLLLTYLEGVLCVPLLSSACHAPEARHERSLRRLRGGRGARRRRVAVMARAVVGVVDERPNLRRAGSHTGRRSIQRRREAREGEPHRRQVELMVLEGQERRRSAERGRSTPPGTITRRGKPRNAQDTTGAMYTCIQLVPRV